MCVHATGELPLELRLGSWLLISAWTTIRSRYIEEGSSRVLSAVKHHRTFSVFRTIS